MVAVVRCDICATIPYNAPEAYPRLFVNELGKNPKSNGGSPRSQLTSMVESCWKDICWNDPLQWEVVASNLKGARREEMFLYASQSGQKVR
jgi:hypothetical protein